MSSVTGTLHLTRGLPASGKTTFAIKWVDTSPETRARVNRDDLRMLMYAQPYGLTRDQENHVTQVQQTAARALLTRGIDVIIDDTNLNAKFARDWLKLADELHARVAWHDEFLEVPVAECMARDAVRDRSVGNSVIERFYKQYWRGGQPPPRPTLLAQDIQVHGRLYIPNTSLPKAILIDLDGTIAHNGGHRGFFEWAKVGDDTPHDDIIWLVRLLYQYGQVIPVFVSGRSDICYAETLDWIKREVFTNGHWLSEDPYLFMRKDGDGRKDAIVKLEIFDEHIRNNFNVLFCLDDRDQVVNAYRGIGLRVLQVAPGNF